MNDLEVIVEQKPGEVRWNFEDLKTALREEMKVYKGMVYDEDSIKTAKSDAAMLRKLKKSVEDKRREIKNKCLEPYSAIEGQAKELNALIDEPISTISAQISDYEEKQRSLKRAEIKNYMDAAFSGMTEEMAAAAKAKIYDSRWENATAKKSEWKAAVDSMAEKAEADMGVLKRTEENPEYLNAALEAYKKDMNLGAAMDKLNELHRMEQIVTERRRKAEEAAAQKTEEANDASMGRENYVRETHSSEFEDPAALKKAQPGPTEDKEPEDGILETDITVWADSETIDKIVNYIKFMGVKYKTAVR